MTQGADIRCHTQLEPRGQHTRELSGSADDLATITLLRWVARYDLELAADLLARDGFQQEQDVRKRLLGEEHPSTMSAMNSLSSVLWSQGDLPGARRLEESALEVRKRVRGEEHPDTLTMMNNLAITLWQQGERVRARRLQETRVAGLTCVLGPIHPLAQDAALTLTQMRDATE